MFGFSPTALKQEFAQPTPPSEAHVGALSQIPHCPVFCPTFEEYANPFQYIEMIRPTAEPFGCCLIVPPFRNLETNASLNEKTFAQLFENCSKVYLINFFIIIFFLLFLFIYF